jgi:AcrR family transcriptional regulator
MALRDATTLVHVVEAGPRTSMPRAGKTRSMPSAAPRSIATREHLPAEQVIEVQRARLLGAVVEAIWDVGYARVTVAQVIGRARVSRKTFYRLFTDRDDCVAAAFDEAIADARSLVREAYGRESGWRDGVRAALSSLLVAMDERPALAWLCLVEAFSAGEIVLERRVEVLDELAQAVDRARTVEGSHEPPQLTAEGVVGAVFAVLHKRILEQSEDPLANLVGPLMSVVVLPYLGARAASRELRKPPPTATGELRERRADHGADLLNGLEMRLTYRTMRVLAAIAEQPGASNREIAQASGITDQGQISKMMSRLERQCLVENLGTGQERGAANSWHLTPHGVELEQVIGIRPLLAKSQAPVQSRQPR